MLSSNLEVRTQPTTSKLSKPSRFKLKYFWLSHIFQPFFLFSTQHIYLFPIWRLGTSQKVILSIILEKITKNPITVIRSIIFLFNAFWIVCSIFSFSKSNLFSKLEKIFFKSTTFAVTSFSLSFIWLYWDFKRRVFISSLKWVHLFVKIIT